MPIGMPFGLQLLAVSKRSSATPLSRKSCHSRATKTVENYVSWLGVVKDRGDDRQVRHLGVITVCLVELVCLTNTHIYSERLSLIDLFLVVRLSIAADKVLQEGIRAGGIIRRIRHPQDCFVTTLREAGYLAKLRILELLLKQRQEVISTGLIVLEGEPEAYYRIDIGFVTTDCKSVLVSLHES